MAEVAELEAWDYIAKLTEKLTFIRLRANEGLDITEDDYDILKMVYRMYREGEHPFYQSKPNIQDETAEQIGLFDRQNDKSQIGTEIDSTKEEINKI